MEPTKKSPHIMDLLEDMFGRSTSIQKNHCIPSPIGCGLPITGFRDELSEREYRISDLCQKCQDKIFGVK